MRGGFVIGSQEGWWTFDGWTLDLGRALVLASEPEAEELAASLQALLLVVCVVQRVLTTGYQHPRGYRLAVEHVEDDGAWAAVVRKLLD